MKRLLWTVALMTFFVLPMNAQNNNYSRLWSKVRQAEKEGKPQTAAGYLKDLEEKTIKAGDELEQLAVSETLYEKLREYNWKEANAYYPKYSALNRRIMVDSLDAYIVKYKDHPRIMTLLYKQLSDHKDAADRRVGRGTTGEDYKQVRREAEGLLRHKYVGTFRSQIQGLIDGMDSRSLYASSHETMAPCEKVKYEIDTRNVDKAEVKVYRLLDNRLFLEGYRNSTEETLRKNGTLVSSQTVEGFACDYNIREEKDVYVDFPQPGVYVVRFAAVPARSGEDVVCYDEVCVSDVAGAMRIRNGRLEVYAADYTTGKPFEKGVVSLYKNLYKNNGSAILNLRSHKTDRFAGEGFLPVDVGNAVSDRNNNYQIRIEAGDDIYAPLLSGLYAYNDVRRVKEFRYDQGRILTDRALYKPTDTIHFKVICFEGNYPAYFHQQGVGQGHARDQRMGLCRRLVHAAGREQERQLYHRGGRLYPASGPGGRIQASELHGVAATDHRASGLWRRDPAGWPAAQLCRLLGRGR